MPRTRLLEEGDELALPWDDLSDGRAWPLVRGRDFFLNPKEVEEAARNAALRLGKAVQTIRTLRASVLSIWVQFADYEIEPGAPCPCGSVDLRRINDAWAICASCESTLLVDTRAKGSGGSASPAEVDSNGNDSGAGSRLRIFVPEGRRIGDERKRLAALRHAPADGEPAPKFKLAEERREAEARDREEKKARIRETRDDTRRRRQEARERLREQQRLRREVEPDAKKPKKRPSGTQPAPRPQPEQTLDRFTNVRLWTPETQQPGRYWGYGYDRKGRFVLLEVTLELTPDGVPVEDPAQPGRPLHTVSAVRSSPFSPAVDADALLARPDGMTPEDVFRVEQR